MTLMPVSRISDFGDRSANFGGLAWIGAVFRRGHRPAAVDRLAEQVEHAAERLHADGHLTGLPVSIGVGAAHEAVGRAEGDAADATAAEVLLDLADEIDPRALGLGLDGDRVVNLGQMSAVELDVERRPDDLDDRPFISAVATMNHSQAHGRTSVGFHVRNYPFFGTKKLKWWAACTSCMPTASSLVIAPKSGDGTIVPV